MTGDVVYLRSRIRIECTESGRSREEFYGQCLPESIGTMGRYLGMCHMMIKTSWKFGGRFEGQRISASACQ